MPPLRNPLLCFPPPALFDFPPRTAAIHLARFAVVECSRSGQPCPRPVKLFRRTDKQPYRRIPIQAGSTILTMATIAECPPPPGGRGRRRPRSEALSLISGRSPPTSTCSSHDSGTTKHHNTFVFSLFLLPFFSSLYQTLPRQQGLEPLSAFLTSTSAAILPVPRSTHSESFRHFHLSEIPNQQIPTS